MKIDIMAPLEYLRSLERHEIGSKSTAKRRGLKATVSLLMSSMTSTILLFQCQDVHIIFTKRKHF